jgi:4-hydroxybenzoate polyprenyltransferase
MSVFQSLVIFARLVKLEHSIFALPFAYLGLFWAAEGWPGLSDFLLVTVAMVAVRSFAMAVNRVADLPFDRINPRTKDRPSVTGEIAPATVRNIALVMAGIFVVACGFMNTMTLALSPVALFLAGGYSYAKRFTWLCHFWLGAVLGLAPMGGWLAHAGSMDLAPVLMGLGVTLWVAGFDILYALLDIDFDREVGLHAVPARFGTDAALLLSGFSHGLAALLFLLAGWAAGAGWFYFLAAAGVGLTLVVEHAILRPDDPGRINMAFFTINGAIAVLLFVGVLGSVL